MTNEEKQLLLTDLCARLPYHPKGVKLNVFFDPEDITVIGYTGRFVETVDDEIEVEQVRLYLRPMSSMTKEEFNEYMRFIKHSWEGIDKEEDDYYVKVKDRDAYIDWLLEHHLDFRGLISMALALEAPERMYKTE